MFRLISLSILALCLALSTGCKMCASHTDIFGSPVPNASVDGYHRAGSYFGGYSGGGYYINGYSSTASPQHVYDSEFSKASSGQSRSITTTSVVPAPSTFPTQNDRIIPAVIRSEYSPQYANGMIVH